MLALLAQLPDSGYVMIACVVVALVSIVGMMIILRAASSMKQTVVEELRSDLGVAKPPLIVAAHEPCASLSQHEDLQSQFDTLADQRTKDVRGLHIKIEQGLELMRNNIAAEFKEVRETQAVSRETIAVLKTETAQQTRQLSTLDHKMDQILMRLPRT